MYGSEKNEMRQIHIRVAPDIHRKLKVMAAMRDVTVSDLLLARVVLLVTEGDGDGTRQ